MLVAVHSYILQHATDISGTGDSEFNSKVKLLQNTFREQMAPKDLPVSMKNMQVAPSHARACATYVLMESC